MAPPVTKADLVEAEKSLAELEAQLRKLPVDIGKVEQLLIEKNSQRSRIKGELDGALGRKSAALRQSETLKTQLAQAEKDRKLLDDEIKKVTAQTQADVDIHNDAEAARRRIDDTWAALRAVREEIAVLEGDNARSAAFVAAGAELSLEVAPAPTPQCPGEAGSDLRSLWADGGDGRAVGIEEDGGSQVPRELRLAMQVQVVIAALQRSLCVRAAELREGLRQWGFAKNAVARTTEMSAESKLAIGTAAIQTAAVIDESERLHRQHSVNIDDHGRQEGEHEELGKMNDTLHKEFLEEKAIVDKIRFQRDHVVALLDEATRTYEAATYDHNEAGRQLEQRQGQLESFAIEEPCRLSAAQKLLLQAEDQHRKGLIQLEQTKQELVSFQEAHITLKQAHEVLGIELEEHKIVHASLKDEQENLNTDLQALSRHYMSLLPSMPGLQLPLTHGGVSELTYRGEAMEPSLVMAQQINSLCGGILPPTTA